MHHELIVGKEKNGKRVNAGESQVPLSPLCEYELAYGYL